MATVIPIRPDMPNEHDDVVNTLELLKDLRERVTILETDKINRDLKESKQDSFESPKNLYFNQYLDQRFKNIEDSATRTERNIEKLETNIEQSVERLETKIEQSVERLDNKIEQSTKDIKDDNKVTRHWIMGTVIGTGVVVLFGLAAIFFSFAQIQSSWMQIVISFATQALKIKP